MMHWYKIRHKETFLYHATRGGRTCWLEKGDFYTTEELGETVTHIVARYPDLENKIDLWVFTGKPIQQ